MLWKDIWHIDSQYIWIYLTFHGKTVSHNILHLPFDDGASPLYSMAVSHNILYLISGKHPRLCLFHVLVKINCLATLYLHLAALHERDIRWPLSLTRQISRYLGNQTNSAKHLLLSPWKRLKSAKDHHGTLGMWKLTLEHLTSASIDHFRDTQTWPAGCALVRGNAH